jgi:hypothetical protein
MTRHRRLAFILIVVAVCLRANHGAALQGRHVYPKDRIQDALDAAAADAVDKTVYVQPGRTVRPRKGRRSSGSTRSMTASRSRPSATSS